MKKNAQPALQKKMSAFCREMIEDLAKKHAANYPELLARWQELHNIYLDTMAESLQHWAEIYGQSSAEAETVIDKLESEEAVIEFLDMSTGKLFRRKLPIHCLETANGIVLSGETMEGKPAKIAFLSETAMQKISDLMGKGPDAPPHGRHEH